MHDTTTRSLSASLAALLLCVSACSADADTVVAGSDGGVDGAAGAGGGVKSDGAGGVGGSGGIGGSGGKAGSSGSGGAAGGGGISQACQGCVGQSCQKEYNDCQASSGCQAIVDCVQSSGCAVSDFACIGGACGSQIGSNTAALTPAQGLATCIGTNCQSECQ